MAANWADCTLFRVGPSVWWWHTAVSSVGCAARWPAPVSLRGLGDSPFQWTCMTGMPSPIWAPDRSAQCLWKAPGHTGQGPHCPIHQVHLHQAIEQGTCDWGPPWGAKFKFPGLQKSHISKNWGFTKFNVDEFENMVAEKRLIPDGGEVTSIPHHGPRNKWWALCSWEPWLCPLLTHAHWYKSYFPVKKKSYTMTNLDSSQGHKDGSTYVNQCDKLHQQKRKAHDSLHRCRKSIW